MRTTITRRASAVALAGVLALAGAACGDDGEDTGTDVDITQEETTQPAGDTTIEEQTTMEETTELSTDTSTEDMGTSTEDMGTSTEDMGSTETSTETTG